MRSATRGDLTLGLPGIGDRLEHGSELFVEFRWDRLPERTGYDWPRTVRARSGPTSLRASPCGRTRRCLSVAIHSQPRFPILATRLEAVLGRLSLPRADPGIGRRLGGAHADEAVTGGGAAGIVEAFRGRSSGHWRRLTMR